MPILFNEDDHFGFGKPMNNFAAAIGEYASWGFHDKARGDFEAGYPSYQIPPVSWRTETARRSAFFELVREITGAGSHPLRT